jgi:hypothetical protein
MNSDPHTDLVTVQSATPARPGEPIGSRFEALTLDTDPCPTGLPAMDGLTLLSISDAPYFAAKRHHYSQLGHRETSTFFDGALFDVEMMGLLKQAEKALNPQRHPSHSCMHPRGHALPTTHSEPTSAPHQPSGADAGTVTPTPPCKATEENSMPDQSNGTKTRAPHPMSPAGSDASASAQPPTNTPPHSWPRLRAMTLQMKIQWADARMAELDRAEASQTSDPTQETPESEVARRARESGLHFFAYWKKRWVRDAKLRGIYPAPISPQNA